MSPRSVFLFRTWTLQPDREPDAEPVTYAMRCVVCGAESDAAEDFLDAQHWTFRHAGRNPSHHTYRELIMRPWRAWMDRPQGRRPVPADTGPS
ncbi:hypothetical protein [Streptomyces sp. I05A-00742]|uniref:DUF7848 domain-containing protein n=1 Tax=Streptomyces sp. I05A-00742 TaxID=2732853 RepID=UPI00289FDE18|nr:hypothetical protein [Streptomyces sp. I05A-00742]